MAETTGEGSKEVDRYLLNDHLTAFANDEGIELDDDLLNDLTHIVADVLDDYANGKFQAVQG